MRLIIIKKEKGACLAKPWRSGGFTLVELMVAIAVFSIVMVTAMSALLNVIDANNKSKTIKTVVNNVSFALEGISKDMRMGTDYKCLNNNRDIIGCETNGNIGISFKSSKKNNPYVYYIFENGQIKSCISTNNDDVCDGDYLPITSSELTLTDVKFYVLNTESQQKQPRMIMTLSGLAGDKAKTQTAFDLQTGVSQRIRD